MLKVKRHPLLSQGLRVWDAAEYLGVSESRLNQLRTTGEGPHFTKLGRYIWYDIRDLDAWVKAKRFKSTADYEAAR